jgi:hypothetical protein
MEIHLYNSNVLNSVPRPCNYDVHSSKNQTPPPALALLFFATLRRSPLLIPKILLSVAVSVADFSL